MTDAVTVTPPAIERDLDLAASPDRVWRALTDSAELASWFSQRADVPTAVGHTGWLEWDGHDRFLIRIEAFEPGRRLAWRWASSADADFEAAANLVEWTLEPRADGGTSLHLRETGFATPDARRDNVGGWIDELGELVAMLATESWERGIRRTWHFRSEPDRVWGAFGNGAELASWWGSTEPIEIRPGYEGWFVWEGAGRFAVRIERVEPPHYLSWRWTIESDVPLDRAAEVLRTEWVIAPAEGGGTDVHLLETGFCGPEHHGQNGEGWDSLLAPSLAEHLGEDAPATVAGGA